MRFLLNIGNMITFCKQIYSDTINSNISNLDANDPLYFCSS